MDSNEDKLIQENQGLVAKIARSFKPTNYHDFQEYLAIGNVGLLNAIRKHTPSRGKLSTLAWWCIKREILQFLKKRKAVGSQLSDMAIFDKEPIDHYIPSYLNPIESKIISLKIEGNSLKKIGDLTNHPISYVYSNYKKAIQKIREANAEKESSCS